MNFISEIEQQRAKIQAEIDEIRLGNKKTHADFHGEPEIDSELHQLDIPLSEIKSYSEPETKKLLENNSIVEDLPNLSHYVNQYLQPQISPDTQITQVTQESQIFQNVQITQLTQGTQETHETLETQEIKANTQDSFLAPTSFPITETPIAPHRAESRSSSNHTKLSSNNTKSTTNHSRKSWFERAADGVLGSSRNDDSPNLISDHLNSENQNSGNILAETESSINFSNPISSIHRTNSSINSLSLSSGLTPRQYSSINLTGTGSNQSINQQSMNERSLNEQSLNSSENSVNYRNLEPVRDLEAIPDENHENSGNERHIISRNTTTPQISDRTVSSGKSVSFRLMTPVTDHGSPVTGVELTEPADLTLPQSESFQLSHHESLSNMDFSPIREDNQGRLSQFDDTSAISLPPNMTMNETGQSDRSVQLENYLRRLMEEREDLEEFLHKDDK